MKKFSLCLFLCVLFSGPVSLYAQSGFKIDGYVKELNNGDKLYLAYHFNGVLYKDSTTATNHTFTFNGTVGGATIGYICARENPFSDIEILHDQLHVCIEPGDIKITGNDSLRDCKASGTKNNEDYFELINDLSRHQATIYEQSEQAKSIKYAFVSRHKSSYISLVTLGSLFKQNNLSKVDSLFKLLAPALKNSVEGNTLAGYIVAAKKKVSGDMAGDFELPNLAGKLTKLSDYRGRFVLLDFWASWCLPCREENPNVKAAFERFKSKNFTVLSVSIDNQKAKTAWRNAVKADGLTWGQVLDATRKVHDRYGIVYIPANFLIDPTGKIIAKNLKGKALFDKLDEVFGH